MPIYTENIWFHALWLVGCKCTILWCYSLSLSPTFDVSNGFSPLDPHMLASLQYRGRCMHCGYNLKGSYTFLSPTSDGVCITYSIDALFHNAGFVVKTRAVFCHKLLHSVQVPLHVGINVTVIRVNLRACMKAHLVAKQHNLTNMQEKVN